MLYVSRFAYSGSQRNMSQATLCVGVVDSDDNIEEIITQEQLHYAVIDRGQNILGVDTGLIGSVLDIEGVYPFQIDKYVTPKMQKLSTLYQVDLIRWKSMVTSIQWGFDRYSGAPPAIRLSDYGTECADMLFIYAPTCYRHRVTLVLDNKCIFSPMSFCSGSPVYPGVEGIGVKFDCRDLTNDAMLKWVYSGLSIRGKSSGMAIDLADSIIDHPARKLQMMKLLGR